MAPSSVKVPAPVAQGDGHPEARHRVDLGHGRGELVAVALGQASRDHQPRPGPADGGELENGVDRLLARRLDEGAGVDHHQVGASAPRPARSRPPAASRPACPSRPGSWGSPGSPTSIARPPQQSTGASGFDSSPRRRRRRHPGHRSERHLGHRSGAATSGTAQVPPPYPSRTPPGPWGRCRRGGRSDMWRRSRRRTALAKATLLVDEPVGHVVDEGGVVPEARGRRCGTRRTTRGWRWACRARPRRRPASRAPTAGSTGAPRPRRA